MDHDRAFKELLSTFFFEFAELFLPDVVEYLDASSIEFLDKEVFTDVLAGEKHEVDLVVKARFREQETFFLIHVENQASPQSNFPERMFTYFARLYEKHRLPVYPLPFLIPRPSSLIPAFGVPGQDRATIRLHDHTIESDSLAQFSESAQSGSSRVDGENEDVAEGPAESEDGVLTAIDNTQTRPG